MADAAANGGPAAGDAAAAEGEERDAPAVLDNLALTAADVVPNVTVRDALGSLKRKKAAAPCYEIVHELSDTDKAKSIKAS